MLEDAVPVLDGLLEAGGEVTVEVNGSEMLPLIRGQRDTVTLVKKGEKQRKGDIVLYKADDGRYLLRRIVYVNGNTYVASGDNETKNEYNITDDRISAVAVSYDRRGKTHKITDISYKLYVFLLPVIKPVFYGYKWLRKRAVDFIKFLFKK